MSTVFISAHKIILEVLRSLSTKFFRSYLLLNNFITIFYVVYLLRRKRSSRDVFAMRYLSVADGARNDVIN